MESTTLELSTAEHYQNPSTRGEWALSVFSLPAMSHQGIVAASEDIRHRVYRVATAGNLIDAGYPVVADDPPHALVKLINEPTEEMWTELRMLFAEEHENPFYKERKQR
jgi:hypothetical protein